MSPRGGIGGFAKVHHPVSKSGKPIKNKKADSEVRLGT